KQQVLGGAVHHAAAIAQPFAPTTDGRAPLVRDLAERIDAQADVLTALRVVRRCRQQRERSTSKTFEIRGVELLDRRAEAARIAAHLAEAGEADVAIAGRVLDALSRGR